jgi:hypothetical protein
MAVISTVHHLLIRDKIVSCPVLPIYINLEIPTSI